MAEKVIDLKKIRGKAIKIEKMTMKFVKLDKVIEESIRIEKIDDIIKFKKMRGKGVEM